MAKVEENENQKTVEELQEALVKAEEEKEKAVKEAVEKALEQAQKEKDEAVEKALNEAKEVNKAETKKVIASEKEKIHYHMTDYRTSHEFSQLLTSIGFSKIEEKQNRNWILYTVYK